MNGLKIVMVLKSKKPFRKFNSLFLNHKLTQNNTRIFVTVQTVLCFFGLIRGHISLQF